MNILGLVFGIFLILSYGYLATWDKQKSSEQIKRSYLSHHLAYRNILNQYESEIYNSIHSIKQEKKPEKKTKPSEKLKKHVPKRQNRECARINLWPLIQEGKENHPLLYELSAKLFRELYGFLNKQKSRFEYAFLDQLLFSAKKQIQKEDLFSLEKIQLPNLEMQKLYYKMLKGSKTFPSLLEYIKAKPSQEKLCVFHADKTMLTLLLNEKAATTLEKVLHQKKSAALTKELIERVAFESHLVRFNPDLFDLLQLSGYFGHKEKKKMFTSDEHGIFLRKNLSI